MGDPFTQQDEHVLLAVRITPKASRNALGTVLELPDGRHALAVRIAAPPVEGAANAELIAYLARMIGVARRDMTIASGETGRLKLLRIRGDVPALVARLRAAIAPLPTTE